MVSSPELAMTTLAREGFFVGVNEEMRLELIGVREHRGAVLAGVRTLSCVDPQVSS